MIFLKLNPYYYLLNFLINIAKTKYTLIINTSNTNELVYLKCALPLW